MFLQTTIFSKPPFLLRYFGFDWKVREMIKFLSIFIVSWCCCSNYELTIEIDDGSLAIENVDGSLAIEIGDGSLAFEIGDGSLALKIDDGSLAIENVDGSLAIENVDGSLAICFIFSII